MNSVNKIASKMHTLRKSNKWSICGI